MSELSSHRQSSPFHAGEIVVQESIGAVERMAEIGRKIIRDFMPDQHREFMAQLPFVLLGAVDPQGDAWATLATGRPGFVASPDPKQLDIHAARRPDDPADAGLEHGHSIGLLGIELHTRRRNRVNGTLRRPGPDGFTLAVEQSFGNCPKYIRLRDIRFAETGENRPSDATWMERLNARARALISAADTFFVASYADRSNGHRQVDVSHRGGKSGFVRIDDDDWLTIPDFAGNRYFNTLGNILINGKAGLLFVDFETGDLLQLSGDAEVNLDPESDRFQGSERFWTFKPRRMVYRPGAIALRWNAEENGQSPFSMTTGSWEEAQRLAGR
ncbi:flavin-nucleotide-binding protein [Phyllobacterium salinisoli]|uniref:Flavin-nucleotide-binding protein n=1 Tax=Phyllobacterium salinisoli TaxID=1899321 RepID=A0A368JZP1_9HYPH|nr:pyridoxamine 5'-phosphate oxidase family protein [Phyllobacterium salinisoli]RCS22609.1 flavin-nucleotide-binding protein [Phyllobacterium salinisoli]